MGLVNKDYYIRVTIEGSYYIYKNKKERLLEKKAPAREDVLKKYSDILKELQSDVEATYYLGNTELIEQWKREFEAYVNYNRSNKFPLMKKYIKDVVKTLPEIVNSGKITVKGNTLEEVYEYVKKYKIFGDTEDDI